jgi:hypothetical protein
MLPGTAQDVVKAEHELKLREAERIHRLSRPAEHSRPLSILKSLQNLLARN